MTRNLFRFTATCSAVVAALAAPFGCAGGGGPAPVDTTTYCGKAAVMYCANVMACCTGAERAAQVGEENVNDEAWCQHDKAMACEINLAETYYAIDKGTVKYVEAKATKCIDAMKRPTGECAVVADVAPWADACKESPFEGQVAADGECRWSMECVKGSSCVYGKCKAPPAEGENCSLSCAEGLYCKAGKCAKDLASGATCTSTSECGMNLYCDKTCMALKSQGTACTANAQCDSNDCGYGTCTSDGSSCSSNFDCDGVCKKSGDTCYSDYTCGSYCASSGTDCNTDADCNVATSEKCLDDTCEASCGGRVCAAKALDTYNYCKMSN
ncbi:MAG TPA: hypothetical protein VGK67_00675 [Myxococcales bacterium]|jgi:hypothetical protein